MTEKAEVGGEMWGGSQVIRLTTSVRPVVKTPDARERRGVKQSQGILIELTVV